jgi:hypothetical protein
LNQAARAAAFRSDCTAHARNRNRPSFRNTL